jgi:hypothetical protein
MNHTDDAADDELLEVLFDDDIITQSTTKYTPSTLGTRPSYEQQIVINHLLDGDNVVVDSVSGSGKSTTILAAAEQLPDSRILQLTFNAMLRKEVQEKVKKRNIRNMTVHTFHSLAVLYYHKDAHKDIVIRKILYENLPPKNDIPRFDMAFLDEAQDMTLLYYMFIAKFFRDMGHPIQLCVLGDFMQGIYQFKGADIRFLTKAKQIWRPFSLLQTKTFRECSLSMSYRITNPMADFVNHVMLGNERLMACKQGTRVKYIRNSRSNIANIIIFHVRNLLSNGESPSDIFILAASIKKKTIRKIENCLVERGIPCYVPMFEMEQIDDKVIDGKVVFSTFHSVKGRERKHVFVFEFDNTYFTYHASKLPTDVCPNTLYVAATRATHNLYLLENDQFKGDRPLDFLKLDHFQMRDSPYIDFKGTPQLNFDKADDPLSLSAPDSKKEEYHDVTPTSLIQFIRESVIEEISPILDRIFTTECAVYPENEIDSPHVIRTERGYHEDVSDLNGIAIPIMYYDHISESKLGANILLNNIRTSMEETRSNEYTYLKKIVSELPETIETVDEYLYLANVYVASKEKLYFKLNQIERHEYTWLTRPTIRNCIERLDETVGTEYVRGDTPPLIEYTIIDHSCDAETAKIQAVLDPFFVGHGKKFRFAAVSDIITEKTLWELKYTSTISLEHQLQVLVYAWLWQILHPDAPREVRVLNIRTGEIQRLQSTLDELTTVVVALLKGKYEDPEPKTDEEFVAECVEYIRNI